MVQKYAFIIMIKEKWWNRFLSDRHEGKQMQSYVQKGVGSPKNASVILFYVTKPVAEIAGQAEFVQREVGDTTEMWEKHGGESVLKSQQEYRDLVGDRPQVSFIRFRNLREATHAIPLAYVLMLLDARRLSRRGFYVNKEIADKLTTLIE